jgi:hypothetical protein
MSSSTWNHRREGSAAVRLMLHCCLLAGFALCIVGLNAQSVTITNVFQNHYHYGYPIGNQDCPSGYTFPSGQYPSTYHLERGHAIHHVDPKNAANDYWVYWAHFDNSSYGIAEVAVFKSTSECGPYILQTYLDTTHNTDGAGYGFRPGGWQSRDDNIFRDTDQTYNSDGTVAGYASAYLITASDSLGTVTSSSSSTCSYANDSMAIFKMTSDYMGIDTSTNTSTNGANWVFVCDQREAPVMFRKDNKYFLITSQAAGWYPSQGGYGVSSNPLTGWTADPLKLGNSSTFGGQTSDGFMIAGTTSNAYVLTFDHLGGADSKNPSSGEKTDTGEIWLPVILDSTAATATLNWYSSWSVDNTTGVLTLPTLTNVAKGATVSSTVATSSSYPLSNAIDGDYATRWSSSISSSGAFSAAKSSTSALCPVTGATTSTTCNPSLIVDLGTTIPVQEIDLSQYMLKGSEPFYKYKIAYSVDKSTWTTLDYTTVAAANDATAKNISVVPFSNNITYGFNALPVDFSARYVALIQTGAVTQNNSSSPYNSFYVPNLYEMGILQSTAPAVPQQATVTVAPSTTTPATDSSFTVKVTVSGPSGQPTPTGYVQLSTPEYISETYGLVSGVNSFTIPAGALNGGDETITVSYRADPTSVPVYGTATTTGTGAVSVSTPDAPANLTVTQSMPGTLTLGWSTSIGAASYVVQRSVDGGSYAQLATPSTNAYVDTGLNNDSTQYCYRVASVNSAGPGSYSSPVCSTATASFLVSNLAVTKTAPGALTISFTAISSASSYIVNRSVAGGAYAQLATMSTNTYIDNGLTPDSVSYCYTIAAVFSTGTASASAPVCSTASANFIPTNFAVTKWASGALYLSWLANGSGTDTYTISRTKNGGSATTLTSTATIPQYVDSSLTNDSDVYCYTVAETQNSVSSPASARVCNTPTANFITIPNYSFESPTIPLWSTGPSYLTTALASWTFVGSSGSSSGNNSGISNQVSGTWAKANGAGAAPLGVQLAYLEEAGSISQTISGFTSGQQYTMLASASQRQVVSQTSNPLAFSVAGTVIGTAAPAQSNAYYADYGFSFVASGSTQAIALIGTSSSSTSAVLVDNVRIFPSSGSAVTATAANSSLSLTQGQSSVNLTPVTGSGGATTLFYQIYPNLPSGLSFSTTTGAITGSPTAASSSMTYTVTVGDNEGGTASATFTLTVSSTVNATISTATSALTVESTITPFVPVSGSGGTEPLTYTIAPVLPSGVMYDASTGAVEGIPLAVVAPAPYTVTITDKNSVQAQASFQLSVQPITPILSISCAEVTYDGKAHSCTGTATNASGTAINGSWSFNPASVTEAGSTTVTGTFASTNSNYASGETITGTLVIDKAPSSVSLRTTPVNAATGQLETMTAIVTGTGVATGSVVLSSPSGQLCTATLNASGVGICTFTPTVPGNLTITAQYAGDSNHASGTAAQTLFIYDSAVKLQLANTQLTYPGATNVTTCISPATATGTVRILDGTTQIATLAMQGGGCSYWYIAPGLDAGSHLLTAVYSGDNSNAAGSSLPAQVTVSPVSVRLAPACWNASFAYGQNYQCTVNLSSNGGTPTGAITYSLDGISAASLALSAGNTQFTLSTPAVGSHSVAIGYAQQGNYAAATTATENFTVTAAPVVVALTPSSWHTKASSGVTLQAEVSSWSAGAPNSNGTISFYDGSTLLASVPVDAGGKATFSSTDLSVGSHIITATYAGGTNYATGTASVTITLTL